MVRIGRGSWALCAVCLVDLVSTVVAVVVWGVEEANPVMAFFLHKGLIVFCAAKVASFVPAVIVLECYRRRNPAFVSALLKFAVAGYAALYLVSLLAVNLVPAVSAG
jgi:hypothetical protein